MTITQLKKFIESLEEAELKVEIYKLYKKHKAVKQYYQMELGSEAERKKIFDKAKDQIKSKFISKSKRRTRRPRIVKVNQILKDLAARSIFDHEMADLYMYTAEEASTFLSTYRYYSEPLLNCIINSYTKACIIIADQQLQDEYSDRSFDIIRKVKAEYLLGSAVLKQHQETFGKTDQESFDV